ncbi:hypothetical protein HF295_08560 [Hujiaoplasma nucleasis]|uniref:Uncharacterized protein n=1 Tax=Hujiaoplasma nucleasis TaxID=2725268 RepID=A0A7L6N8M2_9MOLU|nr:hypothetical protein [Hujiaoplasma nucleasis]QLY40904.1 hypothetical protein HF295_08560 [Hujiaoplasma nucleasis]
MKKKILLTLSLLILIFTLGACSNLDSESTTLSNTEGTTTEEMAIMTSQTEETTVHIENQWNAYFPTYDNYDPEIFVYATVFIWFNYDTSEAGSTIAEKKEFYETNNQEYYDELELENLSHDDLFISMFSTLVMLTYRTKVALFNDFSDLQNIYQTGKTSQPLIELNTVMKSYFLTLEDTIDDLIELTDMYFNTEIIFDSISVTHVDLLTGHGGQNNVIVIDNYDDYLLSFPEDNYDLSASYFNDYDLVIMTSEQSSSVHIHEATDAYFINENTLEIVISATLSLITTTDLVSSTIVVSLEKNTVGINTIIKPRFDFYYPNGAYADRPYHNTID